MSAIAQYLKWDSIKITGSDRLLDSESTRHMQDKLKAMGCRIFKQDGSGITKKTSALVVSTAIEESNPDIIQARNLSIPIFHRSDILAAIVETKKTVAVAGTNGKSTVAALIFHFLLSCGKKPSLIIGACLHSLVEKGLIGNAYYGGSDILVIEADESDGSLAKYRPFISIFLNLSKDHKPVEETLAFFQTLANQSSFVFINDGDGRLDIIKPSQTFGFDKDSDFFPDFVESDKRSVMILKNGMRYILPFPGRHMLFNMLAALDISAFLGCKEESLEKASSTYKGLQRRFDRIETSRGVTVIDDYAHNPDKIFAVLKTVQSHSSSIFAIFQPHGFKPTKFMFRELVNIFNNILREEDTLFILPIYYAGGTVAKEISSRDIVKELKACKGKVITPKTRREVISYIVSRARSGDSVISMGARDPSLPAFALDIANAIDAFN